ncbi:MAG: hypothetical protein CL840_19750 [Crocinitomicaceae bacterium]|nr:hypothetical protein [Crocinitomicaceae bacterium]|tara:strand:+ start:668 stop:850 length:183 start_codon:yes stop_codon:yes gene_type:complete
MKHINSGYIIGGGTLIGMGVGQLYGNMKAFMFIGIGVGLVVAAMAAVIAKKDDKKEKNEA